MGGGGKRTLKKGNNVSKNLMKKQKDKISSPYSFHYHLNGFLESNSNIYYVNFYFLYTFVRNAYKRKHEAWHHTIRNEISSVTRLGYHEILPNHFQITRLGTGIHPQYPIDSRESEIIRLKHGKNV